MAVHRPARRAGAALAEALRDARRGAGLTGAGLADALGAGWGQPKVSKIESGRQEPTEADLRAWAAATSTDPQMLSALHDRARHEASVFRDAHHDAEDPGRSQEAYAAADAAAKVLVSVDPTIIPGLLQTPDYARALLALTGGQTGAGAADDEIAALVAGQVRRSAILYEPGRSITVLIGEAALHHLVGSPEITRAQIEQIARLATTTQATVGIIPFENAAVLVPHGWVQRDQIVTLPTTAGDLEIADPVEVERYERWSRLLLEQALTGAAATERCDQILRERSGRCGGGARPGSPAG